jgi:hypothetical protein
MHVPPYTKHVEVVVPTAIVMSAAENLTRAGQAFDAPIHPGGGVSPVHVPNATQAQITESNCQFAANLVEHSL